MTLEPREPRPKQPETEGYLRRLIGEGTRQFYSDGCLIVEGHVNLETRSHMLYHCARELESAVREVLIEVLKPAPLEHECRIDEERLTHTDEIRAIVSALQLRAEVNDLWINVVTGKKYGGDNLAASSHRRGL